MTDRPQDPEAGPHPARRPVEWVDLGEIGQTTSTDEIEGGSIDERPRRPRPRGVVVIAVLVAIAFVAALLHDDGGRSTADARPKPGATGAASATTSPATEEPTAQPGDVAGPPQVIHVSPRLLGVTAGWELFGRGSNVTVRVQLSAGRITLTPVPELASGGPVAFVTGEAGAIIRPLDEVPGYVVPDGESAAPLRGLLRSGGAVLPGPDLRQVWVDGGDARRTSVILSDFDGNPTGVRVVIPSTALGPVASDSDGFVLFSGIGGVYDARPSGLNRITAGTVVAVGAQRVLAIECSDQYKCSTVVLGLRDGSRRVVSAGFPPTYSVGAIAPDGSTAAVPEQRPDGGLGLSLFHLTTGRSTRVANLELADTSGGGDALAWSPDSAFLFALDADGEVRVVDPRRGSVGTLGVTLPPLSQLAVRPQLASSG